MCNIRSHNNTVWERRVCPKHSFLKGQTDTRSEIVWCEALTNIYIVHIQCGRQRLVVHKYPMGITHQLLVRVLSIYGNTNKNWPMGTNVHMCHRVYRAEQTTSPMVCPTPGSLIVHLIWVEHEKQIQTASVGVCCHCMWAHAKQDVNSRCS